MIQRIIQGIVLNGAAVFAAVYLLENVDYTGGIWFFLAVGIIAGILNAIVKPLIKLLSLPIIILSGGLFLIVINIVILVLVKWILDFVDIDEIKLLIDGTGDYIVAGLIFGVVNWVEHLIFRSK